MPVGGCYVGLRGVSVAALFRLTVAHLRGRMRKFPVGVQMAVCMRLPLASWLLPHRLYRAQAVNPGHKRAASVLARYYYDGFVECGGRFASAFVSIQS